ncbi:putative anaerobic dehydrogenase [Desulfocapsa sulfexigens DSM 10523]|uniref:Putative anaerobic dehydrogenase n=2 Tax=Desulfocapsa TaxID=53318 RepID=M1PAS5_DESSD|nr:putative anaerobic dehydrogenase [Desulfocapsa sulfexigens DSM 10523]
MTNSIGELIDADVLLITGSNTTETHPQIGRNILEAVDRGAKLLVIDPRKTDIARQADIHLALRPGTDIALINAMMRIILDEDLADDLFISMRTENFIALRDYLHRLDLDELARITEIDRATIREAACIYARSSKSVICYCLGVTQHTCGTDNVQAVANLAMLTGNVEKKHSGVDPLRGQNNVQGACDMAALPAVLPGYQSLADLEVQKRFRDVWKHDVPTTPGKSLTEMTHSGKDGAIKAMFIMGENPALSDPHLNRVKTTLENLDFLAVSDIFLTETAQLADVVFPAASFAEKGGTITNSERRVQICRRAIPPIHNCRPDSHIIMDLGKRIGCPGMDFDSDAEIMEEISLLTPIYGGMHHDRLARNHGLQWPCLDRNHPGTEFLHKYYFARGKGRFTITRHQEPYEKTEKKYPFTLVTGRGSYHHYHTATMSRNSKRLVREYPLALLEINRADCEKLQLKDGETVELSSKRGTVRITTQVTDRVKPGTVFSSFHFFEVPINELTVDAMDPKSKCPEFKVCAVQLKKVAHD